MCPSVWKFSSYFSVIDFSFNSIMVKAHILHDFYSFKFLEVYFTAQDIFCGPGYILSMLNVYSAIVCSAIVGVSILCQLHHVD